MYLPVPPQPDCASAWREAVRLVDAQAGHEAYNVIIDVADPTARTTLSDPLVSAHNDFLVAWDQKPIETVANTIFPASLYNRFGAPAFFDRFRDNVLPRLPRRSDNWSGYYFERMMQLPQLDGTSFNQLWDIVERIRDPKVRALNKFEISIFDPSRDVDKSPYGGQCLSFASLKIIGKGDERRIGMTAFYRNHFYIEKLLGNLIGLGRLMAFLGKETGFAVGPLTIVSTHAQVDQPRNGTSNATRADIVSLLQKCDQANASLPPSG
jgi:hypothetical protein